MGYAYEGLEEAVRRGLAAQHRARGIRSAADLESASAAARGVLQKHAQKVAALIQQHRTRREKILADDMLSSKAKGEQLDAAKDWLKTQAAALGQERQEALDTLAGVHKLARQPQVDPSAQLLAEMQQQAAWRRAEKLKASGQDWTRIIREAGERGDTSMLAALRTELPYEVAGMNLNQPGYAEGLLELVGQAEAPHLSELEAAVRTQEAQVAQMDQRTLYNERALGMAVEDGRGEPGGVNFLQTADGEALPITPSGADALRDRALPTPPDGAQGV